MRGVDLWEGGLRELVCITPPGGELSPASSLDPTSMGKAPGLRNRAGQWVGYPWRNHLPGENEIRMWDTWGANIGVHAQHWPAFDIDVDDPDLADSIREGLLRVLGPPAWVRDSKSPASILAYRADGPITKHRVSFMWKGREQAVELLGDGQQWVAAGVHPSGKPYQTRSVAPGASLTPTQAQEALEGVQTLLGRLGASEVSRTRMETRRKADPEELEGDPEEVAALVASIPNDSASREDWIRFGAALKGALPDDESTAFLLFCEWSDRWSGGVNTPESIDEAWRGLKPPFALGIDYLRGLAGVNTGRFDFDPVFDTQRERGEAEGGDDGGEGTGGGEGGGGVDGAEAEAEYRYSDQALASRFLDEFGKGILHAGGAGWYTWDGTRWFPDRDGKLVTTRCMSFLRREAQDVFRNTHIRRTKREGLASRLGSSATLASVLGLCSKYTGCAIDPDKLDADPFLLNTPDGTVDLRTGLTRTHDPADLCTKITAVAPKRMDTPRWNRFLHEITLGDPDYMLYIWKVWGYAITGDTSEHALFFLYGVGGNGKGVLVNTTHELLGGYAAVAPSSTFTMSRNESHPTDLAGLHGARFVSGSEVGEGKRWDAEKVKRVTGGDPVTARRMREDFFTFTPTFKLIVLANDQPTIGSMDKGWERRLHLLPFDLRIPDASRDLNLQKRLIREEGPGILQWMVEGAVAWGQEGIRKPEAVAEATEEYFEAQDPVALWLEAEATITGDPEDFVSTSDLIDAFRGWCAVNHYDRGVKLSLSGFGNQLKRVFPEIAPRKVWKDRDKNPQKRRKGWRGLRIETLGPNLTHP